MKYHYLNIQTPAAKKYMRDAEAWIKTKGEYFSGSMGYSKVAVAEFMANQDGFTMIPDFSRGKE